MKNFYNEMNEKNEKSFKEERIRKITFIYYSLPEIKKYLFKFSQNRECIPRYYEAFGKRPDSFQYENDIIEHVRNGATSFHCSEELWRDALEISTEMQKKDMDELRIGWDLLLDVDSPYFEYSKIYANLLIESLRFHGVENIGVKFSGSKGFHIIIPWKAFPEEIYNQKTKNMFPDWARIICEYLSDIVKPRFEDKIISEESLNELINKTGEKREDLLFWKCLSCNRRATKKILVTWICPYCKIERTSVEKNKKILKCPECRKELIEKTRREIYLCEFCNISSDKNPELFEEIFESEKFSVADLILVASRHLFRMPYSLHEKTALASVVIDKENVLKFQIKDANPFKINLKEFYPEVYQNEAKQLLLQALDWKEQKNKDDFIRGKKEEIIPFEKKSDFKKILIENPSENIFPPQIKLLLQGVKNDGRKRALFILLSFFSSLGANEKWIEDKINEWNERNYNPLKKGYVQAQLNWYKKNPRLPPNFDNPIYRELGVDKPDELTKKTKNPVGYAMKRYFMSGN